jgi:single-strand DNA-binding protein
MEGTLVADPELRYSPSGVAVGKFRLAANGRKYNREKNEWVDDKVLFMRVTCFQALAEHAVESLRKGDLAVVIGKISTEEWTDDQGVKRSNVELVADSVAASLQFRTIPHGTGRAERSSGEPAAADRWASGQAEEAPF